MRYNTGETLGSGTPSVVLLKSGPSGHGSGGRGLSVLAPLPATCVSSPAKVTFAAVAICPPRTARAQSVAYTRGVGYAVVLTALTTIPEFVGLAVDVASTALDIAPAHSSIGVAGDERLVALSRLPDNWNNHGAPAPSSLAIERARQAIGVMAQCPDRVAPDAEGGVALYLFGSTVLEDGSHRRLASLVVGNDGEMALLLRDRVTGQISAFDVASDSLADRVAQAKAFVSVA